MGVSISPSTFAADEGDLGNGYLDIVQAGSVPSMPQQFAVTIDERNNKVFSVFGFYFLVYRHFRLGHNQVCRLQIVMSWRFSENLGSAPLSAHRLYVSRTGVVGDVPAPYTLPIGGQATGFVIANPPRGSLYRLALSAINPLGESEQTVGVVVSTPVLWTESCVSAARFRLIDH